MPYSNLRGGLTSDQVTTLVGTLVPNPLTFSKGGTEASNVSGARTNLDVFSKSEINPVVRSRILVATSFWTGAGSLNGSGSPSYNGIFSQGFYQMGDTVAANWEARVVNSTGNGHHLPGTYDTIDWSKEWSCRVKVAIRCPAKDNNYITLLFGSGTTPTSPSLVNKGVKFQVRGNTTTNKVEMLVGAYNSVEVLSTAADWPAGTNSTTYVPLLFRFVPNSGFHVYANGSRTASASITSQIPTGTNAVSLVSTAWYGKNLAASSTAVLLNFGDMEFDLTSRY